MISPRAEAEANQRAASDPDVSAFVAASAGSGKTRLLTDRLLRLMVGGAEPERILCLTFTKTAAAEMSLRLQKKLGEWVALDDAALDKELRSLAIEPNGNVQKRARSLFARVLDLPGGMRIETIHAFCQSLLRRFPLEAELSPHFQLAEDRDASEAMSEAREAMLASVRPSGPSGELLELAQSLRVLAGVAQLGRFSDLVTALKQEFSVARDCAALAVARRRMLGVTARDRDGVIAEAVNWQDEPSLRMAARDVAARGSTAVKAKAARMLDWLGLEAAERAEQWPVWRSLFLTSKGEAYASSTLVNGKLDKDRPELAEILLAEAARVQCVESDARAAEVAAISEALCSLAAPLLDQYESRKQATGLLEFDDLIRHGTRLLVDPGAAWVMYKLDGRLEHLLLDEAQDTAPDQWKIARQLANEFFAGAGVSDATRTMFAVGDRKQSIFSFQGADVTGFDEARSWLRDRVNGAGLRWEEPELHVSFRSTAPVLELVDAVFADPIAAAGVVADTEPPLAHRADRAGHAGRVELWRLTEAPPPVQPAPWTPPERNQSSTTAIEKLASDLALWIREQTSGGVMLESQGRALRPGDVMILLRRRKTLFAALVRALKALGVPVSGMDRMVLTEQPAVQDLMALCDAVLLPQDDLTFACLLTSPLGGLDDNDLMALAINRGRPLWEELHARHETNPAWSRAWNFFSAVLARADYVTPHALLAEALGPMGGRAALLARLGAEAAEPIDELLNAALSYTSLHPPSLQGFLQWLRRSGAEIKREAEAAGDQVRIMTVHGAKGLQAPLVILPDTTALPNNVDTLLWATDKLTRSRVPIWVPRGEFHCDATRELRAAATRRRDEEYNRLLYVALTRAEDRLLVCGIRPARGSVKDNCWYSMVARGMERLTGAPVEEGAWHASAQTAPVEKRDPAPESSAATHPPAYLGHAPMAEPARPMPLAPSRPEGAELGSVPASASPLARVEGGVDRFKRGSLIHALLQHLPALPEADWRDAALRYLRRPGNELLGNGVPDNNPLGDEPASIADEVLAILRHADLAPLFGPNGRAEVPLTGLVGDVVVGGLVDRIAVLPGRVLLADYKTNRRTPASPEATPVAYLRQMASYRAVLRGIFPDHRVQCALVWTREARVMLLPDSLLDPHEPGRPASHAA